jgi:hypothetical protein
MRKGEEAGVRFQNIFGVYLGWLNGLMLCHFPHSSVFAGSNIHIIRS